MKRLIYMIVFSALLFGISMCPTGYCLDEPVILTDFSSFVWSMADRRVAKNNSYSTYTYLIPSSVSAAIDEYVEHLMSDYGMERIALSDDPEGNYLAAFRILNSEINGFRTQVGGETVRGCHVLMDVRVNYVTEYGAMLTMYVCRGIEVHKDAARSILIPSPAPTTPHPDIIPDPISGKESPEPTFYCAYCQNQKKIKCKRCGGDGKVTESRYMAGYNGVGSGGYITWEEKCPVKQCVNGYILCPYCLNR